MVSLKVVLGLAGIGHAAVEYASTTSSKDTHTTTYPSMTLEVWYTSTLPGGATTVWEGAYTPTFSKMWSTIQSVKSGQIGLGNIDGSIGTVRTEPAYPAPTEKK